MTVSLAWMPPPASDAGSGIRASETVISNLRVLAFDQRLGPEAPPKDKEDKAEGAPVAKTATLEVSPRQAEVITLAQTLGTLSLVLNSVRDGGSDKPAKTEAVSLGADRPSFLKAAEATGGRRQTLESDVTSTNRVQIVRGVKIGATATPSEASAAPAATPTE